MLEILYIWATGLRAKKSLGAKNPRRRGKKEEKGREKKKEERGSEKKREWEKLERSGRKRKKPNKYKRAKKWGLV